MKVIKIHFTSVTIINGFDNFLIDVVLAERLRRLCAKYVSKLDILIKSFEIVLSRS